MENNHKISEHFTAEEIGCPCGCGLILISWELVYRLEVVRVTTNAPIHITSWYRCADHNRDVGGSPASSHMKGLAVHIAARTRYATESLIFHLVMAGFRRIGVGENFVHTDVDHQKGEPRQWWY